MTSSKETCQALPQKLSTTFLKAMVGGTFTRWDLYLEKAIWLVNA